MKFNNWKLDRIENLDCEEFYHLIDKNRNRIQKTFPVTVSNCVDIKATKTFIINNKKTEKETNGYYFYIRSIENNNLIGYIGIKKIDYHVSKCELFYFIDEDFEGKGIISKSVSEVIDFCFNELKMNKVFICTSKFNYGSQQVALKNGFILEGTLREEFKNHEGVLEDINYYGLLKSDYK